MIESSQFVRDFEDLLEEEPGSVSAETRLEDLENWDSVNKLSFMVYADETHGVTIDPDAVANCETVAGLFSLLRPAQAA